MKYVIEGNESSEILLKMSELERTIGDLGAVEEMIKKTLKVMHINNKTDLIKYHRLAKYYMSIGGNDIEINEGILNYKFDKIRGECLKFEYPDDLLEHDNREIEIYLHIIDIYLQNASGRKRMIDHFMNRLTSELCICESIILYYLLDFSGIVLIDMSYLPLISNGVIGMSKETYEILYDKMFRSYVKVFSGRIGYDCALLVVGFLFP
jgi:hypothetical protein